MPIETDEELAVAVKEAGVLLQEIQDYCGRKNRSDAKVRFPRGYLRTAGEQRNRLKFVQSKDLKANLLYTLILTDSILWLLVRTDIAATAKDCSGQLQPDTFNFLITHKAQSSSTTDTALVAF